MVRFAILLQLGGTAAHSRDPNIAPFVLGGEDQVASLSLTVNLQASVTDKDAGKTDVPITRWHVKRRKGSVRAYVQISEDDGH